MIFMMAIIIKVIIVFIALWIVIPLSIITATIIKITSGINYSSLPKALTLTSALLVCPAKPWICASSEAEILGWASGRSWIRMNQKTPHTMPRPPKR